LFIVYVVVLVVDMIDFDITVTDLKRLEEQARDGPSDPNALAKWRILNRLHDRNETMYYKVNSFSFFGLFAVKAIGYYACFWFLNRLFTLVFTLFLGFD